MFLRILHLDDGTTAIHIYLLTYLLLTYLLTYLLHILLEKLTGLQLVN